MSSILSIQALRASYGASEVLHGIDITLPRGDVRAILGANAAGKSTIIKAILGLVQVDQGSILLDETVQLRGMPPHQICKSGVAWVPQGRLTFSALTVRENLLLGAFNIRNRDAVAERLERMYALFPVLSAGRDRVAGAFSGGEQQMLCIARALMSGPRVLLMDEPSVGLAPKVVGALLTLGRTINASGVSILIVEQNARLALKFASWAYVLERGSVVASGAAAEIEASDAVRGAYLGNYRG